MNLAPVRGSYLESYCGASPAHDMRPLQGQKRELMSTAAGDRGKPLSWNMRPFQGQSPHNLHRAGPPGISLNSLLRRLRLTVKTKKPHNPKIMRKYFVLEAGLEPAQPSLAKGF